LLAVGDELWMTTFPAGRILRIDPMTGAVLQTIPMAGCPWLGPQSYGYGSLWVGQFLDCDEPDPLVRLDPGSGVIQAQLPVVANGSASVGAGAVWITTGLDAIDRIDPTSLAVQPWANLGATVYGITNGFGSLWAVSFESEDLWRVDTTPASLVSAPASSPVAASPPDGVLASTPLVPGLAPALALVGYGSIWVDSHRGNLLFRIDPRTNQVVAWIDVGQQACGGAIGDGKVWLWPCFDGTKAVAVDAGTNRVVGSFDVWPEVFTPNAIWALHYDGHLHEVDPTTLAPIHTYDPFQDFPVDWAVSAGGFIWAVAENGNDGTWGGSIAKIDPVSHSIVGTLSVPGVGAYADISADLGYIWVKDDDSPTLLRIDPATEQITTFDIPGFKGRLSQLWDIWPATGLGSVWLRMSDGLVSRVDPGTGQVTGTYPADPAGGGGIPVVGFDSLWVPNFGSDTVWRDQVTP
jgi:streptogramin lyase